MEYLSKKTKVLVTLACVMLGVFLSGFFYLQNTLSVGSTCLVAPASEYNPIAPAGATYQGQTFELTGEQIETIQRSFNSVSDVTPQLSAPAWFALYCGAPDKAEGTAFIFACDGSHAFAYHAKVNFSEITIDAPPWGELKDVKNIVSSIEPFLSKQHPKLAALKMDPEAWKTDL